MGIKSALNQNYYMDSNEVMDAGERIRFVMAKMDTCMEEADGLFGRISDLADSVPAEARCEALISACENARAGIRKIDFLEYGNRVSQNMFELVNYSNYVSSETMKGMEDIRVKLGGIRGTVAELQELLRFRANSGSGIMDGENGTLQEPENINGQDDKAESEHELTTSYLAAVLSGIGVDKMGQPLINSEAEYLMYAECYRKIESGEYENSYMAARLARLNISVTGAPIIHSAAEAIMFNDYLNRLRQRKASGFMLSMEGVEILRELELADWQLEDVGEYDENGNLIGIWPYYVMVNNGNGTHSSDGGVTIGVGHYVSATEWADETELDHQLLAQYVPEGFVVEKITVNNGDLLPKGGYLVEGADMVPIDVVDQIFYSDIQENCEVIADFLEEKNITVTQNEFDALVIYRFNIGSLSRDAQDYLEEGNRNPDDWYNVWPANRRDICQNLFFGGEGEDEN